MSLTTAFEQGAIVFDSWHVQSLLHKNSSYKLYSITRETESQAEYASLWVIDFPATQEDLLLLCENGMSQEQAGVFFKQAAQDFVDSLLPSDDPLASSLLLTVDEVQICSSDDGIQHTVFMRTKTVRWISNCYKHDSFGIDAAIRLGSFLCDAVAYIKNTEIPQRLLTLDNIFVDNHGNYLLGSFGSELDTRFQSPEEHRGETAVYNGDVCSIGVILYTVLNDFCVPLLPRGFTDFTEEEIADAVQSRHAGIPLPPPRHCNGALTGVILKACAYKANARYSSVSELKASLEQLRSQNRASVAYDYADRVAMQKQSAKNEAQIRKVIYSVITAIVVIVVSSLIIKLYDSTHQIQQPEPDTQVSATSNITNIYLHESDVQQSQPVDSSDVATQPSQSETVNTSSVDASQYPESFFSQIALYHSGAYYLTGTLEQDGESEPTELAFTKNNTIYMSTNVAGSAIGLFRSGDGKVYMVNPKTKEYVELSSTVLRLLGMDADSFDDIANMEGFGSETRLPDEVKETVYRERELIACIYHLSGGKKEVFYLDKNGTVCFIESYAADGVLNNVLVVDVLTADVPADKCSLTDDYTGYTGLKGLYSFFIGLDLEESES